jgi:hypothetical protein
MRESNTSTPNHYSRITCYAAEIYFLDYVLATRDGCSSAADHAGSEWAAHDCYIV